MGMRAVIMAPRTLRMVAAIFAITAMLCVSAASVSASHAHLKEPIDRCDVCSAAHLTAQQIAVVQIVHAPVSSSYSRVVPLLYPRFEALFSACVAQVESGKGSSLNSIVYLPASSRGPCFR